MNTFWTPVAVGLFVSIMALDIALAIETDTESSNKHRYTFAIGACKNVDVGKKARSLCFEIYSAQPNTAVALQPIDEIEGEIRKFSYDEKFGLCADEGIPNQVLVEIMDFIKEQNIVYSFWIVSYPCI